MSRQGWTVKQIVREAKLAIQGYTLSVEHKAVLGRCGDGYVMRSAACSITLPAEDTSFDQLVGAWQRFRQSALGQG